MSSKIRKVELEIYNRMDIIKSLQEIYPKLKALDDLFFSNQLNFKTYKQKRMELTEDIYRSKEYKELLKEKVLRIKEIFKDRLINLGLYEDYYDIVFTFGYKETLCDVFAVGDWSISEKYDRHLPKQLQGSWGMFQIYAPIHGYDYINNKRVLSNENAWVNMSLIRKPDIAYQIIIFTKMLIGLAGRYKDIENKIKRLYLIARDYNGSGDMAIKYANNWISLFNNKEYKNFIK